MGAEESSFKNTKPYEEIYQTSLNILNQTHKYKYISSQNLLLKLFENLKQQNKKYDWVSGIPIMVKKHFGKIIDDVREKAVEEMYKVLNLVMLKNQLKGETAEKEQSKFFRKLSLTDKSIDASTMVRDSILFEDEVIHSYIKMDTSDLSTIVRESFLTNSSSSDKESILQQTVFIQNLSDDDQLGIAYLMEFYNRFRAILEGMMVNATFCSLPLKHFGISMQQKRLKKRLKTSKQLDMQSSIYQQNQNGQNARKIQNHNQRYLLKEINCFVNFYTQFIWEFYKLDQMQNIKMTRLINHSNIHNMILNSVWMKVSWVGERGSEYDQELLKMYLLRFTKPSELKVQIQQYIIDICRSMSLNPVKYLKQVTLIFREIVKAGPISADDLLPLYHKMFYELACLDTLKGKIRLIHIVNKICRDDRKGEIEYAWITWEATLQMLLKEAKKYKLSQLI